MKQEGPHEMAGGDLVKVKAGSRRVGLQDEVPYQSSRMRGKLARNEFTGADRIIHHILWQYRYLYPEFKILEYCFKWPIVISHSKSYIA
jgi:hypothetical protein